MASGACMCSKDRPLAVSSSFAKCIGASGSITARVHRSSRVTAAMWKEFCSSGRSYALGA
jgi:hypothetical protein